MTRRPRARAGRHRLIAKLDQGGMAEVYLAVVEDRFDSGALRVVKIMPRSMASDPTLVDMFLDEARLAVRLGHPHVVQTMEVGRTADESLFIAMEWLEGASVFRLAQRVREQAEELPPPAAITITLQVLDALHYLHELRDLDGKSIDVVHRDVTPSNVFLTSAGHVKLLDFGIAKTAIQHAVTVVGTRKGKIAYLAPEVLAGGPFDRRADVYAAGVVLWELLAGRRLWRGAAVAESRGTAPRLEDYGVASALADVCARALRKEAVDRYPTAAAMADDLERAAAVVGGPMRGPDLARLVDHLLGEDIRNVRRLAANAIRTGRVDDAGERMAIAPEGTSVTVHPRMSAHRSRWRLALGLALTSAASAVLAVGASLRIIAAPAPQAAMPPIAMTVVTASPPPPSADSLRRTARLTIATTPGAATVMVDGAPVSGPPHVVEVANDGAQHVVHVSARGFISREIIVAATGDLTIEAELPAAPPTRPPPVPPTGAGSTTRADGTAAPRSRFLYGPQPLVRALDPSDPW